MKDEIICYCKNVKRSQIIKSIEEGAKNLKDIQKMTKACTENRCKKLHPKCIYCIDKVNVILKEFNIRDIKSNCCGCGEEGY